jgi:hypothetical protein
MTRAKTLTTVAAGISLAVISLAFAQAGGILFPDWSPPSKGTYDAPSAEIGKQVKDAQPWSVTTVTSAIEKPLKGKAATVIGEVVDLSCYLQVGKHGEKHRDCGQKCARSGEPIGLVAKDGTIYTLSAEEHNPRRDGQTSLREMLIDQMAHVITINGTLSEVDGQRMLYVQGFLKQ